jgi:hypothetical protein
MPRALIVGGGGTQLRALKGDAGVEVVGPLPQHLLVLDDRPIEVLDALGGAPGAAAGIEAVKSRVSWPRPSRKSVGVAGASSLGSALTVTCRSAGTQA